MPDFNVYRRKKGRGGSVCIYVRNICIATVIDVNIDRVEGIEDLWLTVQHCRKLPSVICSRMYRHPHAFSHLTTFKMFFIIYTLEP